MCWTTRRRTASCPRRYGTGRGALDRLRPDLAALSVVHPGAGGAADRIRHRRTARVRVRGAGRVGAAVASVLSAAGVGSVDVLDGGRVEPWDVGPGGIPGRAHRGPPGRGRARARCGGRRRTAPRAGQGAQPRRAAALVVLAPRDGLDAYAPDAEESRRLVAAGVPHLYTGVVEGTGVVGPLVLPGRSACGECLGLGLADRDPAWPRMLAQLRSGRQPAVPACDIALATTVAGLAAAHVLAHLDGRRPPSAGARLELSLARLSTRVRPLPGDARCGCGAAVRQRPAGPRDGAGGVGGTPVAVSGGGQAEGRASTDGLRVGARAREGTMAM